MNDAPHFGWNGQGDGTTHEDLSPVWDAVCAAHPLIIEHITGPNHHHDTIGLEHVVRAFHATSVRLHVPVHPGLLLEVFEHFPDGAFAIRVGSELFAKDVGNLWQRCIDEAREKRRKEAEEAGEAASWLTISDEPWDEDALKDRPWLAPPHLMRGHITLLHGLGAAGKSLLIIAWAIALALGKRFGRLKPRQRCRVLLGNFEDDDDEQRKRISAALRFFEATPADLKGWLYRVSLGPKGDATMFALDENGQVIATPCWEAWLRACEDIKPDAAALDPFIAINAVPEKDNQLMRRVMSLMKTSLTLRFLCALMLAHHDNKAAGEDEDSDQTNSRGAGDIVNAVRFEAQVKTLSAKQAEAWGIDAARRGLYFRAGSVASKRNYTAPEEAEWFERRELVIGREAVVYCVPWPPPSARLDDDQAARIIAAVEKGTSQGPYSTQLSNTARSLAPVLTEIGIAKPALQRKVLTNLIDAGRIAKAKWRPKGEGEKTLTGLRSSAGLPYNHEWVEDDEP
jgi:hypothetical protein